MSLFQKKEEWTYAKLGKFLAEHFKKMVLESFDSEGISWLHSSFTDTKESTLLKEWIFFNMFEMFQGISAYFKGSQEGFRILDQFYQSCSEIFTEAGIFENPSTFIRLLMSRYDMYSRALMETKEPGPIYWVSKKFCQLCGNDRDPATKVGVGAYYTHMTIANKNLIANLLKSIRVVEGENEGWTALVHKSYEYGRKGEYWKSIELAQKALEINPRASEAWRLIGNAYEFLGDEMEQAGKYKEAEDFHKKATQAWNKAKEINPNIIIPGYHE